MARVSFAALGSVGIVLCSACGDASSDAVGGSGAGGKVSTHAGGGSSAQGGVRPTQSGSGGASGGAQTGVSGGGAIGSGGVAAGGSAAGEGPGGASAGGAPSGGPGGVTGALGGRSAQGGGAATGGTVATGGTAAGGTGAAGASGATSQGGATVWTCPQSTSPVAGAGGTAGAGNCSVSTSSGGTGTGGTSGPRLDSACTDSGALACNGENQKLTLLCRSGKWESLQTCAASENCDQPSGVCSPIVAACANLQPSAAFCDGSVRKQCSADRTALTSTQCCGACVDGACVAPRCGDGVASGAEECDDGNSAAGDGCEPSCVRSKIIGLSAGQSHTCALLRGGAVRCFGTNAAGELGLAHHDDVSTKKPYELPTVALCGQATAIASGDHHTCALMSDGSVQCWGKNNAGQLGLGHTRGVGDDEPPMPQVASVALGAKATAISAGGDVTCALLADKSVRCWGDNRFGQLGLGHVKTIGDDESPSAAVAQASPGGSVRALGTSGDHTCAVLDANDHVRCWGHNDVGQLGYGTSANIGDDELPSAGPELAFPFGNDHSGPFTSVTLGFRRALLPMQPGGVQVWGYNGDGSLGLGYADNRLYRALDLGPFWLGQATQAATAGAHHACFLLFDQRVRCIGANEKAQLGLAHLLAIGDNEGILDIAPIDLGLGSSSQPAHAVAVVAGASHTCALLDSGTLRCWGSNAEGQLGFGYKSLAPIDYVGGSAGSVPGLLDPVQVLPVTR